MEERIHILIAKKLTGEASEEELHELDTFVAESNDNRTAVINIEKLWRESDDLLSGPKYNEQAAWAKISNSISDTSQTTAKNKTIALSIWKSAAMAAAVLTIGFFVIFGIYNTGQIKVVADSGDKQITLPDNSIVTLKEGGVLSYKKSFNKEKRNITLDGEAFFEVSKNKDKPFIINADDVSVQVLGTSFYVKSGSTAYVAVVTGKVQMTLNKNVTDKLTLTPGNTGQLSNGKLVQDTTYTDDLMYWKTGTLNFTDVSLYEVIERLNKLFSVSIRLSDDMSEEMYNQIVNITFSQQKPEDMLQELCLVTQCTLQQDDNNYIIAPLK